MEIQGFYKMLTVHLLIFVSANCKKKKYIKVN